MLRHWDSESQMSHDSTAVPYRTVLNYAIRLRTEKVIFIVPHCHLRLFFRTLARERTFIKELDIVWPAFRIWREGFVMKSQSDGLMGRCSDSAILPQKYQNDHR